MSGIHWITDACDQSVQELRKSSEFLVSTSFEEGFNLSVAEALLQQIPVLISDNQVHNEIYAAVANFYNLHNPIDLGKKIRILLSDDKKSGMSYRHKLPFANYDSAIKTLAKSLREASAI